MRFSFWFFNTFNRVFNIKIRERINNLYNLSKAAFLRKITLIIMHKISQRVKNDIKFMHKNQGRKLRMIKGSERKIIVLEKLDSPYFEKAYFFVKCGVRTHVSKKTLSAAAEEMLSSMENCDSLPFYGNSGGIATKNKQKSYPRQKLHLGKGIGIILLCGGITLLLSFILFLLI